MMGWQSLGNDGLGARMVVTYLGGRANPRPGNGLELSGAWCLLSFHSDIAHLNVDSIQFALVRPLEHAKLTVLLTLEVFRMTLLFGDLTCD
jgi:hypothetical protein